MNVCPFASLFVATVPSFYLLFAIGRFGQLGMAMLATAVVSVIATWITVPTYGAAGFTGANAMSALLVLAPSCLTFEWMYWRESGIRVPEDVLVRTGVALAAAGLSAISLRAHWVAASGTMLLAAAMFVRTVRLRRRRGQPADGAARPA